MDITFNVDFYIEAKSAGFISIAYMMLNFQFLLLNSE